MPSGCHPNDTPYSSVEACREKLGEIIEALQAAGFTFTNLDDAATFPILDSHVDQLTPDAAP